MIYVYNTYKNMFNKIYKYYYIYYYFFMNNNNNIIFKLYDDDYNNNNRYLDNKLYKFIKYNLNLDLNDKLKLINEFNKIDINYIDNRIEIINNYRLKLDYLKSLPYIEQRTNEWFELRKNCLTASDLFEGISKNNNILAKKKAGVYIDNTDFTSIPALKWGTMFEDMATRIYSENNNNISIHEFGIINNKNIEHFGASPDGISDLGIMIEIKCPYSRKLKKDYIPEKYYYQIQGQLAVCELKECDYVECYFETFDNYEDYFNYVSNNNLYNKNHGIIAEYYNNKDNFYKYLYSDPLLFVSETNNNIDLKINNFNNDNFIFKKKTFWYLKEIYIQKIHFNENLWQDIPTKINLFWDKVLSSKNLPIEYKTNKKSKISFIPDPD